MSGPRDEIVKGEIVQIVQQPGIDLAPAALAIARLEYPRLDAVRHLARLDELGEQAATRIAAGPGRDAPLEARVESLRRFLHGELGFTGHGANYDDPRSSCLNQVLERRTGLPIVLSVVYLEVARRAGCFGDGIAFPGRFLIRLSAPGDDRRVIVDPFDDGAVLTLAACAALLRRQAGADAELRPAMLAPASRREIVVRMLTNLKHLYVRLRSFAQARVVTDLLVRLTPAAAGEVRDRGLLAYHLEDFPAALHDLEDYLRLARRSADEAEGADAAKTWEHVKALRRRVAAMN